MEGLDGIGFVVLCFLRLVLHDLGVWRMRDED